MQGDTPVSERQITGDDIIGEILRNSEAGHFPLRQTVVVPSIYHVYLHPSDFDNVRPVLPALTAEARSALIERLESLNRKPRLAALDKLLGRDEQRRARYRILDPDWTIEFHADAEDKLAPGDIDVFSELASGARPEFDGAKTMHVTRRRADVAPEQMPDDAAPTVPVTRPDAPAVGWISYDAGGSPRQYAITRDLTRIGRGGKAYYVDLRVEGPPDISREHCRIRRDPASGSFFISDSSQFGTAVNGRALPRATGQSGPESPLPSPSVITLAGVLELRFEAARLS